MITFKNIFSVILVLNSLLSYGQLPLTIEEKASIDKIFADWREDSLGCLKLRMKSTDFVISYINKHNKSIDEIVGLLGKPNISYVDIDTNYLNYQYFTQISCIENDPDLNIDYCYLIIAFKSGRFSCVFSFQECY